MANGKITAQLVFLWINIIAIPVYATLADSLVIQNIYLPIIYNAALSGPFEYTVKEGDTLDSIATRCGTDIPTLLSLNPSIDPRTLIIYVGQIILVPALPKWNIVITTIFYHGVIPQQPDEYVEIKNNDTFAIQLGNWTLSDAANHVFTFPSFVIQPGQVCRIYTNENHPEWCGFNYGSGLPIWSDTRGCGYLSNNQSKQIHQYCY